MELPKGWAFISFNSAVIKAPVFNENKIKQRDYLVSGAIPIIDQGFDIIGGYSDDESKIVDCSLPAIVFGDHTKIVKFVNHSFCAGADGIKIVLPPKFLEPKCLYYFICLLAKKIPDKGYARHYQHLEKEILPLPPLAEQHRIVAKIDALFSRLDKGVETLQTIQQQLRVYRQAVLKWAFEGKLTNSKKENWIDTTLGNICQISSGGTPSRRNPKYYSGNIPWIKTGEINWNKIIDSEEHITLEAIENSSAKYFPIGTILVAMYGQGLTRGRAAILEIEATTNQAVCALIPSKSICKLYLFYFFQCNYWNLREKAVGGNQLNLNGDLISKLKIMLPTKSEQHTIVSAIESRLSICDKLEQIVDENLNKAQALKQSILKKAFEGRLVPQDPNDEPAEKLLERIKRERQTAIKKPKPAGRKKNG